MIPKTIHYCWFGRKPLPSLAKKCIASWKKYLPDYRIKEWNEDNFDVNIIPYTRDAYANKKYAFVSDFARFMILYKYGGIYFDTDVEVIRPMYDIIARGNFMGRESNVSNRLTSIEVGVNPGLGIGVAPGLGIIKELLDKYITLSFYKPDGTMNIETTIVAYTSELLCNYGLKYNNEIQECAGITIYPKEYFCPIDYITLEKKITNNTRTIHHYANSWMQSRKREIFENIFGFKTLQTIDRFNKWFRKK